MTWTHPSREALLALNACRNLAPAEVCHLARTLREWSGCKNGAGDRHLARRLGIPGSALAHARAALADAPRLADGEQALADRWGASILTWTDDLYPAPLRDLDLPPPVLYVAGRLRVSPAVAIVGSRAADAYGVEVAEAFAEDLAGRGLAIVSGFARGIDAAAHRGAVRVPAGETLAVLGCGLDVDYPTCQRRLRADVQQRGALLTEHPFGVRPMAHHFPIRNRIIAALSLGVLVVQATPRSGSLITARLALDMGRDVYAVPGRIFDQRSLGPNTLVRDGALLAQHPVDIVESLPEAVRSRLRTLPAGGGGAPHHAVDGPPGRVLRVLRRGEPATPERIAADAQLPVDRTLGALLELELQGLARRYPGALFSRRG